MGASRNIVKNTLLLTIGLYSGRFLALFLRQKMTPILGTEGIGIWTFALSITGIMQTISNFGLGNLLTREVSKARRLTLPLLWNTLKVRWLMAAVCYAFLLGFAWAGGWPVLDRTVVLLMALAVFLEGAGLACDAVLQAHEKVQYQSLGQIASAILYFGLGWWWLDAGYGIVGLVWANLASRVIRLLVMVPFMVRHAGPWERATGEDVAGTGVRRLMVMGFPIFLATTFATIYSQIDSVMLKNMMDNAATGIYGQGRQALNILILVPALFGLAFFPSMARYGQASPRDAARLGERALRFILVAIVPLSFFIMFTARPIIMWFEKGQDAGVFLFADSVIVMQIGIWGLPMHAIAVVMNRLLMTAEREKHFVVIGLVPMLTNIVLNFFLIPRYSYYGAAVATVLSLIVNVVMHLWFLRGTDFLPPLRRALLGPALAALVSWGGVVLLGRAAVPGWGLGWMALPLDRGWPAFLGTSLLMIGLYGVMLTVGRVVRADDLRLLKDLRRNQG